MKSGLSPPKLENSSDEPRAMIIKKESGIRGKKGSQIISRELGGRESIIKKKNGKKKKTDPY